MVLEEDIEEIKRIKVAHVITKAKLYTFTRYFFKAQYKRKYAEWEHLVQIADMLEKVLNGEVTRLIINIAPRYGKTELVVKAFIAYALALNPAAKFIHISYSDDLALDNSEQAKDMVLSDEYQKLFPYVKIKKDSKGKKKWYTDLNGGVYATSSGGQITGFGAGQTDEDEVDLSDAINDLLENTGVSWLGKKANFGGAIIIDDPNKPDDADSETLRNRVNERYDSTISNRVNSRTTPIIIIQQRTHEDDLSGYVIRKQGLVKDGGLWTVLSLPSIKEDGAALCPQKHTIEELKKLQEYNDIVFQRQHMQNPKPRAGLLFPIDDLNFADFNKLEDTLNSFDYNFMPCDPAGDGGDDFAAGDFALVGDRIYVRNIIYNTDGTDFNEKAFADLILKVKPSSVGVESVFGWKETANRIRSEIQAKGYFNDFRMLRPRRQKHSRIVNMAAFIRRYFVFRDDWQDYPQYAKFMRNLTSYLKIQEPGRGNKHDDAPDLCEMAAGHYEKNFPDIFGFNK